MKEANPLPLFKGEPDMKAQQKALQKTHSERALDRIKAAQISITPVTKFVIHLNDGIRSWFALALQVSSPPADSVGDYSEGSDYLDWLESHKVMRFADLKPYSQNKAKDLNLTDFGW